MGFWEKFKEFDKMMSKPCMAIRIEKRIEIPQGEFVQNMKVEGLIEENNRLRKQLKTKKVKSIETEYRLLD